MVRSMSKRAPSPIPVVTVTTRSSPDIWHRLEEAIDSADFISLDLELSGLGNRKALYVPSVEDRYQSLCQIANSHAVISLGVACFKWAWSDRILSCNSCVFDILLLCKQPYLVDPESLHFLISHGFDFNRQYAEGLPFFLPASDAGRPHPPTSTPSVQDLFLRVLDRAVPVVVHNGLVDLIFLYRSFYAPLPSSLSVFVADLSEMFLGGVYDTKNMAETVIRESASYLEYLFHKCWRKNHHQQLGETNTDLYVNVACSYDGGGDLIPLSPALPPLTSENTYTICQTYASHGYCRTPDTCLHTHNILHVLDQEEEKSQCSLVAKKRRKRRRKSSEQTISNTSLDSLFEEELAVAKRRLRELEDEEAVAEVTATEHGESVHPHDGAQNGGASLIRPGHRAGVDAYMTGYCFACYGLRLAGEKLVIAEERQTLLEEVRNKVTLGGKNFPLLLTQSSYSNTSTHHRAIQERRKTEDSKDNTNKKCNDTHQ